MLQDFFRYYWFVFVNGRPHPRCPGSTLPYGREEFRLHHHWYEWTALALVCGLAIGGSVVLLVLQSQKYTERYRTTYCCFSCGLGGYPLPPKLLPPPKGNLTFGTMINVHTFQIPKPAAKKEVLDIGIAKAIKIRDPEGLATCDGCTFDMPEIPEPKEDFTELDPSIISCNFDIDARPVPLNIQEIIRHISFPNIIGCYGRKALIRVLVDKEGNYVRHLSLSGHQLLLEAIEPLLSKLKFVPAIQAGHPIKAWVNIPFVFKLSNK